MKSFLYGIVLLLTVYSGQSQNCYVGTSMDFALYLQNTCGIVYKEEGLPKNPFQSVKDHGGNIVRLRLDLPPYSNSYVANEPPVDYRSPVKVKEGMQTAQLAGLKTMLTFSYQSFALEANESLNPYVAPLAWQSIAGDVDKLEDSVYNYTFNILADFISSGLVPEIVSIGNETNWRILEPNVPEDDLPAYSPQRVVNLLNAGTSAVRDINQAYSLGIKIALHIFDASNLVWWMDTHVPAGLDFDIMGLSHYHAWHTLGTFASWTEVVDWVQNQYQKDFMILETAQLFTSGYSDNRVNVLGTENIPAGYPNPPTTATQKEYLIDLTTEILDAGGLGTIVWGGDWVGSDCYIYPDQYGPGSSFENKTFWDFSNNLHDGIDWMKESCPQNSVSEYSLSREIDIYPIPVTSNTLTIRTRNYEIICVELFSIDGHLLNTIPCDVDESSQATLTISQHSLQTGMYMIKIISGQNYSMYRLVPAMLINY